MFLCDSKCSRSSLVLWDVGNIYVMSVLVADCLKWHGFSCSPGSTQVLAAWWWAKEGDRTALTQQRWMPAGRVHFSWYLESAAKNSRSLRWQTMVCCLSGQVSSLCRVGAQTSLWPCLMWGWIWIVLMVSSGKVCMKGRAVLRGVMGWKLLWVSAAKLAEEVTEIIRKNWCSVSSKQNCVLFHLFCYSLRESTQSPLLCKKEMR